MPGATVSREVRRPAKRGRGGLALWQGRKRLNYGIMAMLVLLAGGTRLCSFGGKVGSALRHGSPFLGDQVHHGLENLLGLLPGGVGMVPQPHAPGAFAGVGVAA